MYEFLEGKLVDKNPAFAIIDCSGVGYYLNISLNTFSRIGKAEKLKLFVHFIVREDAMQFYGFFDRTERDIFRKLIGVSGVGASTARMILSSMTPEEVYQAINAGNVAALKAVKGIGAKSAQRIIVDLKDKLEDLPVDGENLHIQHNTLREEALSALVALGFNRQLAQKGLSKVFKTHPDMNRVEELIKETLKAI